MRITKKRKYTISIILLLLFGILYVYFASTLPSDLAPDEQMRFLIPLYIVQHGSLPLGNDPEVLNYIWGTSYGFSVYGSSLFAAIPMAIVHLFTNDYNMLLFSARCTNACLSLVTLFFCFKIGDLLFKSMFSKYMLMVFVGFLPQYTFLSAYFNSEILEIFASALVIFFLIKGVRSKWELKNCVALGLALGICALSYYYAYGLIIVSIIVYYWSTISFEREQKLKRYSYIFFAKPMLIVLVAFAVSGWFFVRNVILYNDFFGLSASAACAEINAIENFRPSLKMTIRSQGYSPFDMLFSNIGYEPWIQLTAKSCIGLFGYMSILMPSSYYKVYALFSMFGFVFGFVGFVRNELRSSKFSLLIVVAILLTIFIPVLLSVYYSWNSDYQPQGRYLFAGLIAAAIVVVRGWSFEKLDLAYNRNILNKRSLFSGELIAVIKKAIPIGAMLFYVAMYVLVLNETIIPHCMVGFL